MNSIKWLNENVGAVQAVSTFVLILVTAWYAWLTFRISRASVRQALTAEQAYQADLQARVGRVQVAASRVLDLLTGFSSSASLRKTVDAERWREGWLELELAASAIDDEIVRHAIDEATGIRQKWDYALTQPPLENPDEDSEAFRDYARELIGHLSRMASIFVKPQFRW